MREVMGEMVRSWVLLSWQLVEVATERTIYLPLFYSGDAPPLRTRDNTPTTLRHMRLSAYLIQVGYRASSTSSLPKASTGLRPHYLRPTNTRHMPSVIPAPTSTSFTLGYLHEFWLDERGGRVLLYGRQSHTASRCLAWRKKIHARN